jgi:glycosyltransferase involved in cell wall biosynthesis
MKPSVAVIISTFDQPEYLARVLNGIARQTQAPEEIFVADDGSGPETRQVFESWKKSAPCRAEHLWQEHQGFRKSRILNEAIARARADYAVFLDGDAVPHPDFIGDHRQVAVQGCFAQGHRALIGERAAGYFGLGDFSRDRWKALLTFQLGGFKHAWRWPSPQKETRKDLEGVRGCNLGVWRSDLARINGFNEAFTGWGREDSEMVVRLMNSGVARLDVRGWALCYHLWHAPADRQQLETNDQLLHAAIAGSRKTCELGLNLHLS